jgi:cell division septum initiation protein DivIVA
MTVDQHFNIVNEKLQQLLKQYNRLQRENERLREELQQCQQAETAMQQEIEALQLQVTILKVASGELSEKDKKDFEKKINQYIREIDKCISFLSQ